MEIAYIVVKNICGVMTSFDKNGIEEYLSTYF